MRAVAVFALLLVLGASAQEEAGFGSFMKKVGGVVKKVAPVAMQVAKQAAPIVKPMIQGALAKKGIQMPEESFSFGSFLGGLTKVVPKVLPVIPGIVQGSIALHQNKGTPQEILQHSMNSAGALFGAIRAEESGFGSFMKKVGGVVKKVAPIAMQVAKQAAPIVKPMIQGALAKKGIQMPEESFSFGSFLGGLTKVVPKVLPVIPGIVQGSIALHQNKGTPQEILAHSMNSAGALFGAIRAEESSFGSFMKKVGGFAKKVAPIAMQVGKQVAPMVKPFAQQMLASKGIQMDETEEASFKSFMKKVGGGLKKVGGVVKKAMPIVKPLLGTALKMSPVPLSLPL